MAFPRTQRFIVFTGLALPFFACAAGRTIDQGEEGGDSGSSGSGGAAGTGLGGTGNTGTGGTGNTGTGGTGTAGTGVGGSGVGGSAGTGTAGTGTAGTGVGGSGVGGTSGTGSGGTGTAGTGTGGGGSTDGGGRCSTKTTAAGVDGMIDDFSDGNLAVNMTESRMGSWIPTGGTATVEAGALHFTSPAKDWASFTVAVAACYDASKYQGVKFKVWGKAGPSGISFVTPTPPTVAPAAGGSCTTANCGDHFRFKMATIPAASMEVAITWAQLKQNGWGDPAPAGYRVSANLMEFGFSGEDKDFAYDFYVDDVQFY